MHRRRSSDVSLSSNGASSDTEDGEKKKKKKNIFQNLIPRRWKPRQSSKDDAAMNVSGASSFPNQNLTGEAEQSNPDTRSGVIDRSSQAEPLPILSVTSSTSDNQRPTVPPRRRKHSPKDTPVSTATVSIESLSIATVSMAPVSITTVSMASSSMGSSLEETLSPPVGPLQGSRPVIHSRTSSHSSGFEEGSSSLTETSETSWRDLLPKNTDRIEELRWTGESVGFRASSAKHLQRETETSDDVQKLSGQLDGSTTCDEDILVFSPEISLCVDEVLGEHFAVKGNPLASFIHHAESERALDVPLPASDARLSGHGEDISGFHNSTGQISDENIVARTPSYSAVGYKSLNLDLKAKPDDPGRKLDQRTFPDTSKVTANRDFESTFTDRNNNRLIRDGDKAKEETNLRSYSMSDSNSCTEASKEIEESGNETKNLKMDRFNQFTGESLFKGNVPDLSEPLTWASCNEFTPTRSDNTASVDEKSEFGLSRMPIAPTQRTDSISSSVSSTCDKDSPISAVSDRNLTTLCNIMDEKTLTKSKDKPAVAPKPRGNLHGSRSQFHSPRWTSNSSTKEPVSPPSSQTELETSGALGGRKNVSFIVNDEDFGRYHTKPHGIETRMVLPFTERQRLPDLGGNSGNDTSVGKTWVERHFPRPRKPIFPGTIRQSENTGFDERQSSMSKNHQSVAKGTAIIRRHSDRWDTSASDEQNRTVRGTSYKDVITERSTNLGGADTKLTNRHSGDIDDFVETLSVTGWSTKSDKSKSVARISNTPGDLWERNSIFNHSIKSDVIRQDSPAARVSDRPKGSDSEVPENLTRLSCSRISRSRTKDSTERGAGTQILHKQAQEGLYQSETSKRDGESDLELAKKFEAFNIRLAAMASAAAAKRSQSSTGDDSETGKPLKDSLSRGKWMSSDGIFEGDSDDKPRAASVFEGEYKSRWNSEKHPIFGDTDEENYHTGNFDPWTSRGITRSRSEADDDMKAKYHSSSENRNRLVSAYTKFRSEDEDTSEENYNRTNSSAVVLSKTEQNQRLSSSYSDLNREDRSDESPSRLTTNSYGRIHTSLETPDTGRTSLHKGLFRSHSKGEYDQFDPRPTKKTLQEQGEELQRQFSSWHRLLISEKSGSFFDHKEKQDEIPVQPGSPFLGRSFQNPSSECERLQTQSTERTPVRMGTKPIVRRPMSERRVQETSSDPIKTLPWQASYESVLRRDRKELVSSVGSLDKGFGGGGRPLRRSASCAQSQTDLFPRLAMAKFNDDGTPRSILKKSNVVRSQSADDMTEEEEDDDDNEFGLQRTDTSDPVLLRSSPVPPLPSTSPPDLPPHHRSTPPSLTSSYPPSSPQSPNSPNSPQPPFPSCYPPSTPSPTRTSPSYPPPLPPSSPPRRFPSSFPPPTPPKRFSSLSSQTLPHSPPHSVSKSPSPLLPPLSSTSPPPLPSRLINSDTSSSTLSSEVSNSSSTWSPDSGSSKFLGLQNLQKRTAILKKRSRSDLGVTASILDVLNQH